MNELGACRAAFERHAARPALASARRAAGMAWNAVLALAPPSSKRATANERYGRTYVDHLRALAASATNDSGAEDSIPDDVRAAAILLMADPIAQTREIVQILTPRHDRSVVDAAETIAAEAYTRLARHAAATNGALSS